MTDTTPAFPYLEHAGWVRGLARSLVADWNTAEDLVQETWVRALERGGRPGRGWLATVLRNNLLNERRRAANRGARERTVSRDEETPSALDVLEKMMTHRTIVEAVLALDEPYRETILLRYFEQYSCSEVARRMRVPKNTVNSRISRALERLRVRLTERHDGDPRACLAALIPLANATPAVAPTLAATLAPTLTGAHVMKTILGLSALAASLTAVSVLASSSSESSANVVEIQNRSTPAGSERSSMSLVAPDLESLVTEDSLPTRAPVPVFDDDDDPADIWEAELSHDESLDPSVEEISVNVKAGNVEIVQGSAGAVRIEARIRADLKRIEGTPTRVFSDHVSVTQKSGELEIEDLHEENGWSISLVIHLPAPKKLSVNSGAGNVIVRHAGKNVSANSGAGSVSVLLPQNEMLELKANSGAGNVEVKIARVDKKLTVNSGAGRVQAQIRDGSSRGKITVNSGAGKATLIVPSSIIGEFELRSGVGKATAPSALGLQSEERVIGARMHGTVGVGGPKISVTSGAGSVEVKFPGAEPVMVR